MAKSNSPETLLKRLQKIERAQGRLADITMRIRAQAETVAELLKVAEAFVKDSAPATTAAGARRTAAKRSSAERTTSKRTTPKRPTAKRATAKRAAAKPSTTTASPTRRATRGAASS